MRGRGRMGGDRCRGKHKKEKKKTKRRRRGESSKEGRVGEGRRTNG